MELFIAFIMEYIEYIALSLLAYILGKIGLKKTSAQIIAKLKKKNKKLIAKAEKNQKKIEELQKEGKK